MTNILIGAGGCRHTRPGAGVYLQIIDGRVYIVKCEDCR